MKPFRIITLGCKVNQCESAAMRHRLEDVGCQRVSGDDLPEVVVINTCTVTGRAAMQSRQAIRQAVRKYPAAKIVVTGCYAQTAAGEIQAIDGVDAIIGHDDKMRIADWALQPRGFVPETDRPSDRPCAFSAMPAVDTQERTRAFLKIQDGCNTRCTYCIVPYARGRSRSMPTADVHAHLHRLGSAGLREVVLTGIHLGAYGADLTPPTCLAELLMTLLARPPVDRLRLSSIEPTEIDARIIELMGRHQNVLCRHFHIPLQSGDNTVLRRMGRPYIREDFAHTIAQIHLRIPQAAIGVDVIAGFPGESEQAFARTYDLIESLPVSYLHVFPFSARKGTPAAAFKDKVPQKYIKERCRKLRVLGEEKKKAFYASMVGRTLNVLIESVADAQTGHCKGLSDNYVPVLIPETRHHENTLVNARIQEIAANGAVIGRIE